VEEPTASADRPNLETQVARLIIEIEGSAGSPTTFGVARPGNSDPLYLVVSVTRTNGKAVLGLTAPAFEVFTILVGAGGANSTILSGEEWPVGSPFYLIKIVPIPGATWKLGRYVYGVRVTNGTNVGQTVCSVVLE
jgi:hypothetical protein